MAKQAGMVVHRLHLNVVCTVCFALFGVQVTVVVQIPDCVCAIIFWAAQLSENKRCVLMHSHEMKCCADRRLCLPSLKSRMQGFEAISSSVLWPSYS